MEHATVVHDQQIARRQKIGKFAEASVILAGATHHQQPAGGSLRQRRLGDAFWRQVVVEFV